MIIVSGLSGAGKTIALHTLEDLGYYCIDNLPGNLLSALYSERQQMDAPVAVGIDIRSQSQHHKSIPETIKKLKQQDTNTKVLFLTANTDVLIKRFSESRRKHPIANDTLSLPEAIETEKDKLSALMLTADCKIDTSKLNIYDLKARIHDWLDVKDTTKPSITLESFGFKHGIPMNADLLFDVRFLPNPYWERDIRHLNGKDKAIQDYLSQYKETQQFIDDTVDYLLKRLPDYMNSSRSYLTIGIGCTGGKHRSVYVTEKIAQHLQKSYSNNLLTRHRDLE